MWNARALVRESMPMAVGEGLDENERGWESRPLPGQGGKCDSVTVA